jgi:molybdate transport system substrate-binding protein
VVLLLLRPVSVHAGGLLVFAAASLTDALRELAVGWRQAGHEGIAFSFGASNDLARQIEAGAPADVFFSADVGRVAELEKAGMVKAGTSRTALSNTLVVVVPAAAPATIREPRDLKTVRRLALANPDGVPAGMYARKWLEVQGLWNVLAPRVVPALDVRATLAAVEAEQADAGIVYATDAIISKKVRVAVRVPREQGPPIAYALAPIASSKNAAEARALVAFLTSAAARPVYERFGFLVTGGE